MLKSIYLTPRLFWGVLACIAVMVAAHFVPGLLLVGKLGLLMLGLGLLIDLVLLFRTPHGIRANRTMPRRLSNGDDNTIQISLQNAYAYPAQITLIDELPFQFQLRDQSFNFELPPLSSHTLQYDVRPTRRGAYEFGALNVFAATPVGLTQRRYQFALDQEVPVYPSYIQMRKYALYAISDRLTEIGVKKVRRIGHTLEFDQIRPYVRGDDYRTINWKATARSRRLMINQYQDERSQQVYCLIDMGRVMKMPFEQMSLLDYAINAALVISNVAVQKQDKAGLLTFAEQVDTLLPATRSADQMGRILEALYRQETNFMESSYERLNTVVRRRISQRSLLLLFTNFESRISLERQLPYLRSLAHRHLLVVIFFENTELHTRLARHPASIDEVYNKTIAEKFAFEKREMVQELKRYGIQALLTPPGELTINTINTYLELKARRLI